MPNPMPRIMVFLIILFSILCVYIVYAQSPLIPYGQPQWGAPQQQVPQFYGQYGLQTPITPNAYGQGINSDATGRPFTWKPQYGGSSIPDSTIQVQPYNYGQGLSMDQYGRPLVPYDLTLPPGQE